MKILIENKAIVSGVKTEDANALKNKFRVPNPEYFENESMGRDNSNTPKFIKGYEELPGDAISFPRGGIFALIKYGKDNGYDIEIQDNRVVFEESNFEFIGEPRLFQKEAWDKICKKDFGVLDSATGSGKTVMAIYAITQRKQPTLVIVHTKDLLNQWIEKVKKFCAGYKSIGMIGSGKKDFGEITVATIQSLLKPGMLEYAAKNVGFLIVDECHRTPSKTFTNAVSAFWSKYMLGLSATPFRRDRLTDLIHWYIGRTSHIVDTNQLVNDGHVLPIKLIERDTDFNTELDASVSYSSVLSDLVSDPARNWQIVRDIIKEYKESDSVILVLSDRTRHCETLHDMLLYGYGITSEILVGKVSGKGRKEIIEKMESGKKRVLFATGQLIGEGFDLPAMEVLFISTPVRFSGRVVQFAGRIRRPEDGKKPRIYDYRDIKIGVLANSARQRRRVLRGMQ